MRICMTPHAFWKLHWMAQRTGTELSAMGVLSLEERGFTVFDLIVVKQEVSVAHVDLDMAWWADHQVELFEQRGIEPWQTSAWFHTHPEGVGSPSATDEETMRNSFGRWDFAIMAILSKDGRFYARLEFTHKFPVGEPIRFAVPLEVEVLWTEMPVGEPVTAETLGRWEHEFQERVTEDASPPLLTNWRDRRRPQEHKKPNRPVVEEDFDFGDKTGEGTEVNDYVHFCAAQGLDPEDPDVHESYWGWPFDDAERTGFSD